MKTKIKRELYPSLLVGFALILTTSCSKDATNSTSPTSTGPVPVLTTSAVNVLTPTTASCGGNIISDAGSTVTARGVCWSTGTTPTIADSKTSDGTGSGIFTSAITGLSLNTSYYVRAYATNSAGTGYGSALSFTNKLAIGLSYQGGIIAYILNPYDQGYDSNVTHGIIAAPSDQSTSIQWYEKTDSHKTGATAREIGKGNANTNTIVSSQGLGLGNGYAAKLCADLSLNGYSDWYLPSQDELHELCQNYAAIGGFDSEYYWSSTEASNVLAVIHKPNDISSLTAVYKAEYHYVRAVRSF